MGNGTAERFNQTLIKMLATLDEDQKSNWHAYLDPLVQAYNATRSDVTGYSRHYQMFGRHPRLSVDAFLGLQPRDEGAENPSSFAQKLRKRVVYPYKIAADEAAKIAAKNKRRYRKIQEAKLEKGDAKGGT